jgi:hypothetical protein
MRWGFKLAKMYTCTQMVITSIILIRYSYRFFMQVLQYVQNIVLALQFGVVVPEVDKTETNIPISINTSHTHHKFCQFLFSKAATEILI